MSLLKATEPFRFVSLMERLNHERAFWASVRLTSNSASVAFVTQQKQGSAMQCDDEIRCDISVDDKKTCFFF